MHLPLRLCRGSTVGFSGFRSPSSFLTFAESLGACGQCWAQGTVALRPRCWVRLFHSLLCASISGFPAVLLHWMGSELLLWPKTSSSKVLPTQASVKSKLLRKSMEATVPGPAHHSRGSPRGRTAGRRADQSRAKPGDSPVADFGGSAWKATEVHSSDGFQTVLLFFGPREVRVAVRHVSL